MVYYKSSHNQKEFVQASGIILRVWAKNQLGFGIFEEIRNVLRNLKKFLKLSFEFRFIFRFRGPFDIDLSNRPAGPYVSPQMPTGPRLTIHDL